MPVLTTQRPRCFKTWMRVPAAQFHDTLLRHASTAPHDEVVDLLLGLFDVVASQAPLPNGLPMPFFTAAENGKTYFAVGPRYISEVAWSQENNAVALRDIIADVASDEDFDDLDPDDESLRQVVLEGLLDADLLYFPDTGEPLFHAFATIESFNEAIDKTLCSYVNNQENEIGS